VHTTPAEAPGSSTRTQVELRDGRTIQVRVTRLGDGGYISAHEDITEIVRAAAQIEHMASHDGLTGLPNRLKLRERMNDALARVRRGERLAVLCLDLDFFKAVNDTYGHAAGDTALQQAARVITESVRGSDVVCRYGGEEFLVLAPETGLDGARSLADKIRLAFSARLFGAGAHVFPLTLSAGAAQLGDLESGNDMIARADDALYHAKQTGRDRVEAAQ